MRQKLATAGAALLAAGTVTAVGLAIGGGPGSPASTVGSAAAARGCARPYSPSSPWNLPIPRRPAYDGRSETYVRNLGDRLSSDPTQYTYPVYEATPSTPRETVSLSGLYSSVVRGGTKLVRQRGASISLPIPSYARASAGSDASIVIVDPRTGDEWGVWQLTRGPRGWTGSNGYHYNVAWSAVPPTGFGSRGAGVPYLAGLVRPCEIARGRIAHALAFAYDYPTARFVYPATKSDGDSTAPTDVPEGARLQLDPTLRARDIRAWGCHGACLTIARALQRYGMYVIDNSGRPKIMLEFEGTARWNGALNAKTVRPIPMRAFRVLSLTCAVPNVRGKTLAAARVTIRLAQCRTGRVRRARSRARRGTVISQAPRPGTRVLGARVRLIVSAGR